MRSESSSLPCYCKKFCCPLSCSVIDNLSFLPGYSGFLISLWKAYLWMYFYLCLAFPCFFNLKNLFILIKSGKLSTIIIMNTVSIPLSLFPLFGIVIRDTVDPYTSGGCGCWPSMLLKIHVWLYSRSLVLHPRIQRSFRLCGTVVCIYGGKSIYKPTAQFKSVSFKGWTDVDFFQSLFHVF